MPKKTEHAPLDDLVQFLQFLRARLAEDEMWAIEGSREEITRQAPQGGAHWRWVSSDTGDELTPDPSSEPTLGHEAETPFVSLVSREEWTSPSSATPLPQSVLDAEEVPSAAAGHIVRHDPARVLAEVKAKRKVVDQYESIGNPPPGEIGPELSRAELGRVLRLLAVPYADHPDYRDRWRP